MLKLTVSSSLKSLMNIESDHARPPDFLVCLKTDKSDRLGGLTENKGIKEIKLEQINEEEKLLCEREYINNIAELSLRFNSLPWWANALSEKNEYDASLYKNLCLFYSLTKTLENHRENNAHIFVVCNIDLFGQLGKYCEQNSIEMTILDKKMDIFLKEISCTILEGLRIISVLVKTLIKKVLVTFMLSRRTKNELARLNNYYVIRTWLDSRFLRNEEVYEDAFFGKLPLNVSENGYRVLILARVMDSYIKVLKKMMKTKRNFIIPEEFFIKITDFFRLIKYVKFRKNKIGGKILFNGVDVTELYEKAFDKGNSSAYYLKNILIYFLAKRFARNVNFQTYIQTYENYAWEKMMIQGIKEIKRGGKILGFQHAYVSRNSFKYFPGEKERDLIPVPDSIITMGNATKRIITEYGSYNNIFKTGCALRQGYISELEPMKRRQFRKIVVPLNMVRDESVLIMDFLFKSGIFKTDYKVVLRCHPAAPFEAFSDNISFEIPKNLIITNNKTVQHELSDTDMVLYTWTTVAIEALKLGLPVIYLDILSPMYVDPLFECEALKRTVENPLELLPVIESIYTMEEESFYNEQKRSQNYLKEYFYPLTKENITPFLDNSSD